MQAAADARAKTVAVGESAGDETTTAMQQEAVTEVAMDAAHDTAHTADAAIDTADTVRMLLHCAVVHSRTVTCLKSWACRCTSCKAPAVSRLAVSWMPNVQLILHTVKLPDILNLPSQLPLYPAPTTPCNAGQWADNFCDLCSAGIQAARAFCTNA